MIWYYSISDLIWFQLFIYLSSFEIWGHKNKDINKSHPLIMMLSCPGDFMMLQPQQSLASLSFCLKDAFSDIFCPVCHYLCIGTRSEAGNLLEQHRVWGTSWSPLHCTELFEIQSAANDGAPSSPRLSTFSRHPDVYHRQPPVPSSRRTVIEIRGRAHN